LSKPASKPAVQDFPQNIVHLSQNIVHLSYMNTNRVLTRLSESAMNRADCHKECHVEFDLDCMPAFQQRRVNLFYIERIASVFIDVGRAEFMWEREGGRQDACNLLDRAF
jgi:hypothetical protein